MSGKRQAEPLKLHVTYKAALRDVFFSGEGGDQGHRRRCKESSEEWTG